MIPDNIRGKVVSVTRPKIFEVPTKGKATIEKDYYHVVVVVDDASEKSEATELASRVAAMQSMWSGSSPAIEKKKRKKLAKIYFPIKGNISGREREKSVTKIYDRRTGEWIQYPLFNPQKIINLEVEARGNITTEENGNYYINKLTELKIYA